MSNLKTFFFHYKNMMRKVDLKILGPYLLRNSLVNIRKGARHKVITHPDLQAVRFK